MTWQRAWTKSTMASPSRRTEPEKILSTATTTLREPVSPMTSWRTAALRESTVAAAKLPGARPLCLRKDLALAASPPVVFASTAVVSNKHNRMVKSIFSAVALDTVRNF